MNTTNTRIQLDWSKLLGFKLAQSAQPQISGIATEAKIGAKLGSKLGVKLGGKIGAKVGVKPA
jgi:hypothetical protein